MPREQGRILVAQNRKARHDYHLGERFEAGLVLTGTEVKSLRLGRASLADAFATVDDGEAQALLPQVRNFVAEHKHPPESSDLHDLLASVRSHLHV